MIKKSSSANTSPRRATYAAILEAEDLVLKHTREQYGKAFSVFSDAIDALLSLSYADCVTPTDQESEDYHFFVHVRHLYYGIPCAFRSCIALVEGGHYDDANNCLRSILEGLVKYKFLLNNKDKIVLYEKGSKDSTGEKVTIKRVFEESCGTDVQEKVYRLGSRFEHKSFIAGLPFLRARLNQDEKYSLVPVFQEQLCEGIINQLVYLLFGFLNLAEHFLSIQWANEAEKRFYKNIKRRLAQILLDRRTRFPAATPWNQAMDKVVCLKTGELEAAAKITETTN